MQPVEIPAALWDALDAYRTCEFATLTKSGLPIAWPAVPRPAPDGGTILITTSIGLPQKAHHVRRDPRVALLFSDPTGCGRTDLAQVLVRGTATCPDELITSPAPLGDYWQRMYSRQPVSASYSANAATRWLFDWYYMRLRITVTPTEVTSRPPLGERGLLPPPAPAPAAREMDAYSRTARRLAGYRSAVLVSTDEQGWPHMVRVRPVADPAARALRLDPPPDEPLRAGPATLLLHRHDERLWDLHSFVTVGELIRAGDGWSLVPTRFIPGAAGRDPVVATRGMRNCRRAARDYLAARAMARPEIPWDEYVALKQAAGQPPAASGPEPPAGPRDAAATGGAAAAPDAVPAP